MRSAPKQPAPPDHDAHWMRRAIALARSRSGSTWPNPAVGAVIVRDGVVLAEGVHTGPGRPHGEAAALAALPAAGAAEGATIYVTLEPCHHVGRTPPCTRALADAGIARVVYAVGDSNPTVSGGGATWLREQGIAVQRGPLTAHAWELHHPFFETEGGSEPHVTLKLALSADGRLARRSGPLPPAERRITGAAAHRRVHALRAASSAVLVGRGTVECDRPRLTARVGGRRRYSPARSPRPVVLDSELRAPVEAFPSGSLVFSSRSAAEPPRPDLEVVRVARSSSGLNWREILSELQRRNLGALFVEGGAEVANGLLASAPPHRIHLFLSPKILGGDGPRFEGHPSLEERYTTFRVRRVGEDIEWLLRRRDLPPPPSSALGG